jgi:hypothetical protein
MNVKKIYKRQKGKLLFTVLTTGSGIQNKYFQDPIFLIPDPGSQIPYPGSQIHDLGFLFPNY